MVFIIYQKRHLMANNVAYKGNIIVNNKTSVTVVIRPRKPIKTLEMLISR